MDKLATTITTVRDRLGLSQRAVGERLGVSASLVSKWEKSERVPDQAQILALSEVCGVSPGFLLGNVQKAAFEARSLKTMPAAERQELGQALNDATQQIHWVQRAWDMTGKIPARFNLRLEWADPALSSHADMVRTLLNLNACLTLSEMKQSLAENHVLVFDWDLPAKLFGLSYRKDFTVIFLNHRLSENQRLFTLAHELAHLIFHLHGEEDTEVSDLASRSDPHEKQANRFASELLLPQRHLDAVWERADKGKNLKSPSVFHRLAKAWNISAETLYYRLVLMDPAKWKWSDAKRFYTKGSMPSNPIRSRVTDIASQVAPAMVECGREAHAAETISAQKLCDWWFADLETVDHFLDSVEASSAKENSLALDSGDLAEME